MKDIKGYEGQYAITEDGRVWSHPREIVVKIGNKFLKPSVSSSTGYKTLTLKLRNEHKTHSIHRLLAQTFLPNPDNKPYVNHKDGNKINNSLSNLEWCTEKENSQHAWQTGLMNYPYDRKGEKNNTAKLKDIDVITIRLMWNRGFTNQSQIARDFGVKHSTINDIVHNRHWKHLVV